MNWGQIRARIMMVGGSQLLQKLVGFLVIAVMTRHLARERMGEFFLAAAIGTVAAQATELGTTRHLIRTVARDHAGALGQLARVIALRLPAMALSFVIVNLACLAVKPSLSPTLLLVSFYLLLQDMTFTFSGFFVGLEKYGYRVAVELLGQVLLAGLTLLIASRGGGLTPILWSYAGAHATVLVVMYAVVRTTQGPIPLTFSLDAATSVARQSLPIFAVTLLDTVHFKADTVMLGFLQPLSAVASYEAAYKLFEVSRLVIRPVALIFFPICVALAARHEWPEVRRLFLKLTRIGLMLGAAATIAVALLASRIVPIVFGSRYGDSVPLVRVLFLTAPILFTGLLAVALIHTLHQERFAIQAALGCIASNVLLNAIAIPLWGPIGCAWVTLVTQTLWTVWLARIVLRRLREAPAGPVDPPTMAEEAFTE
jgi:O-antigen/teichoic acid export membrane protein